MQAGHRLERAKRKTNCRRVVCESREARNKFARVVGGSRAGQSQAGRGNENKKKLLSAESCFSSELQARVGMRVARSATFCLRLLSGARSGVRCGLVAGQDLQAGCLRVVRSAKFFCGSCLGRVVGGSRAGRIAGGSRAGRGRVVRWLWACCGRVAGGSRAGRTTRTTTTFFLPDPAPSHRAQEKKISRSGPLTLTITSINNNTNNNKQQ